MRSILRLALLAVLLGLGLFQNALAQSRCDNTSDYFQPVNSGDGQRYPLTIGPLVWHLLGSGVYPVKGSDGMTHVAFAMQFTNVWGIPATIQSVEVVDPSHGDKVSGSKPRRFRKGRGRYRAGKACVAAVDDGQDELFDQDWRRGVRRDVFRRDLWRRRRCALRHLAARACAPAGEQASAGIDRDQSADESQFANRRLFLLLHSREMDG